MRLFIAINFDDRVKGVLKSAQAGLRRHSLSGNFTKEENLHLTLVFLGETSTDRLAQIRGVMDGVAVSPFTVDIRGVGRFRRDRGDIWWMGVEKSGELLELHSMLSGGLARCGFSLRDQKFTPHLTLAREVSMEDENARFSDDIPGVSFEVSRISLMKSERISGRLKYTPVYEKYLLQE